MSLPDASPPIGLNSGIKPLHDLISSKEDWLMNRILHYAKARNYIKYTSTLAEAWRVSIAGLSGALLKVIETSPELPELGPDDDFTKDPTAAFGILEARRHRARGVTMGMFLGLMKYYRRSYLDLVLQAGQGKEQEELCRQYIERFFDHVELGFTVEWCSQTDDLKIRELQESSRELTNEKTRLLTIFESIPDGVLLFDPGGKPLSMNAAATVFFVKEPLPGSAYYDSSFLEEDSSAMLQELSNLLCHEKNDRFDHEIETVQGRLHFEVKRISLHDVSGFKGTIVILSDITKRTRAEEALKKSESAFHALFESSRDAIMLLDQTGFLDCNKATLDIFRCATKDRFFARHPGEWSPPLQPGGGDSLSAARKHIESAYKTGVEFFEWIHCREDGTVFPAEVLLSRFQLGERVVLQAVVRDITDRKTTEQAVILSREELIQQHDNLTRIFKMVEIAKREWEKTMDCVGDMVILADASDKIKRCNRSVAQFTGKPYEQLLGSDWKQVLEEQGLLLDGFRGSSTELYQDHTKRWFIIRSYPVKGIADDMASGTVVSLHDTTDLKQVSTELERTNREINESRELLQSALNQLTSLIQQVEQEKRFDIRFSNPHLKKCYQKKKCVKTGCPCYGREIARCWQIAGTHCGGAAEGDFAKKVANCTECEVFKEATSNPIYHIGEHFNNMMHILEFKNKELEDAYTELKLSHAKILQQEKMASIGQLAAGVAHEINNPMGFIASNLGSLNKYREKMSEYILVLTGVIQEHSIPEADRQLSAARKRLKIDYILDDAAKLIDESLDGADRVKTIVQNLKNFSRIDQTEARLADINDCMETTINIVWNELKYKATLRKEYGNIPRLRCYPQQLNQVFMNLLVNAAHAIEKQGVITIRTWEQDKSIFISVADTGCGIPEKNLARIFEPFFTTKEIGKGTGLGLSIAYDIVKKHNGEITVASAANIGTTFTVRIPMAEPNAGGGAV